MRRFIEYYRQFEELTPEEVSRELRARRDEERAKALSEVHQLDLASPAWHEPPHPEVVNAATFALRRAVNAYPDPTAAPLRAAVAERDGVEPDRVVVGHGAGELLRATLRGLLAGAAPHTAVRHAPRGPEVLVAWPAWGPLPRLVLEAGGEPVPVALGGDGAPDVPALRAAIGERTRAIVLCRPNDPTGGSVAPDSLHALADALPERVWLILDEALAGFLPPGEGAALDRPHVVTVRSFSKAHAMAGFRIGYALLPAGAEELAEALAPVHGASAPAQAGALWAVESGGQVVARRRAAAARERERLAEALAGGPVAFTPGHGPCVWLSAAAVAGRDLAGHLAARRIHVTPGAAWGDDHHVRAVLRGREATDRLAAALRELSAPPGTPRA